MEKTLMMSVQSKVLNNKKGIKDADFDKVFIINY